MYLLERIRPAGVLLNWEPIGNTIACRVQGRPVGAPSFASLNAIGLNKFSAFVPASKLTLATGYEWSVVCACSITPLNLSPSSGLDTFYFPGTVARMSQGEVSIEVLPNPAHGDAMLLIHADELHEEPGSAEFTWQLLSVTGQVLRSGELQRDRTGSGSVRMALHDLPTGVYSVVIHAADSGTENAQKWSLQLVKM